MVAGFVAVLVLLGLTELGCPPVLALVYAVLGVYFVGRLFGVRF